MQLPLLVLLAGCVSMAQAPQPAPPRANLVAVASSPRQWTGVAVSREGRLFVNFPRWSPAWGTAVAELLPDGRLRPFPDTIWNPPPGAPGLLPPEYFVCVQSLHVDAANYLWVLDAANPQFAGVVPDGPKLVRIDLHRNRVVQVIPFAEEIAGPDSYLNDVRVDLKTGTAYITDSGSGALVVVDLATGVSRRLLAGHPSVKAEGFAININGQAWRLPDGTIPQVHVDGLALTPAGDFLYYQALSGRSLYRIPTAVLRDESLAESTVEAAVQLVGQTCVADGLEFGPDGLLYLTDIEHHAIRRLNRRGSLEMVAQDPDLAWPDSLAVGPTETIYVTTSRIHQAPVSGPYHLFRFAPPQSLP